QMIVDSTASDIVYSNLFTGVHGNYLRGSIEAAGLDPNNLAVSDPSAMNFGVGEDADKSTKSEAKPWRDIWGAGQGIGAVDAVVPAAEIVERLTREYADARARLL
ncbi:NAD(P)H-dependent flavin oxidoreductase, partial [Rhodococcus opacus]